MSSLWTPSGERPVGPDQPSATPNQGAEAPPPMAPPGMDDELTDEEMEAQLLEVQRQLAETPASAVITNHTVGMFQLAALHLSQDPPNFSDAQLAIDAMAAIVDGLGERLGESRETLVEALAQIRLGFVQVKNQHAGRGSGDNPNG